MMHCHQCNTSMYIYVTHDDCIYCVKCSHSIIIAQLDFEAMTRTRNSPYEHDTTTPLAPPPELTDADIEKAHEESRQVAKYMAERNQPVSLQPAHRDDLLKLEQRLNKLEKVVDESFALKRAVRSWAKDKLHRDLSHLLQNMDLALGSSNVPDYKIVLSSAADTLRAILINSPEDK